MGGALQRLPLGVALSIASFAIYLGIALSLPQGQDSTYNTERSSIAAAATNVIFGKRPGVLAPNLLDELTKTAGDPLRPNLDKIRAEAAQLRSTPPSWWDPVTRDGNGVGYVVFATAAFRLLGLHVWALPVFMIVLMGCSATAFLLRFGERFAGVVILYFTALTIMLFSPLVWEPVGAGQIPVGGIRYFSLVAVLPAFHLLLEVLDASRSALARRDILLLAAETAILTLAVLIRGNAAVLMGIIGLMWLIVGWKTRRNKDRMCLLRRKAVTGGLVVIGIVGTIALMVPENYIRQGRFGTVIWHRVTISIGLHPAFPFPGVQELFECKTLIPEGLQPGAADRNGHCMFADYLIKHGIPLNVVNSRLYDRQYETALREAFFTILYHYPLEVLTTFTYYKARNIVSAIAFDLRTNFAGDQMPAGTPAVPYSPLSVALSIISMIIAGAYFAWRPVPRRSLRQMAAVALLSGAWTIPPYFTVWATPWTSADLFFFLIFITGLGLAAIPVGARALRQHAVA